MKILFFCRRFYPLIGGVEKHVLEISKRLIEKGHEITVVTEWNKDDGGFEEFGEYEGIKIYRIKITADEKKKKFQIWKSLFENRELIKEADIIHCHDLFYWFLPFKLLFPFKKVFTTFHGYEGSEVPTWNKILSHKMAKWLSSGTLAIGDWHEKWYRVKPDFVSYGAAEKGPLDVACTELVECARDDKIHKYNFCFVGRLAKDTGIMVYLEALKILKDKGKNFSLVVCGDGPQLDEAKKYSKAHELEVEFVGFVGDVEKYIKSSNNLFVSRYLGILEGLLAKKFIYAVFDSPIKEDYLKLAPFAKMIFITKDPLELAEKILYFEGIGQEKEKFVKTGYEWADKQTWEKTAGVYLDLWEKN